MSWFKKERLRECNVFSLVTTSDWPLPVHLNASTLTTNGHFLLLNLPSRHCIQSQFDRPASALVLNAARHGRLSSSPAAPLQHPEDVYWRRRRQVSGPDGVLLKFPQVTSRSLVPVVNFQCQCPENVILSPRRRSLSLPRSPSGVGTWP